MKNRVPGLLVVALSLAAMLAHGAESVPAIADGKRADYVFLDQARQRWRLCAVLPHALDRFFWAVAYGLDKQAAVLGVDLGIAQAGGYANLAEQRRLVADCVADGADAVLLAAIDPAAFRNELQSLAAQRIKVIDLVNGLDGESVAAHSHQDYRDTGTAVARYVLGLASTAGAAQAWRVGWFPGPVNTRWSQGFDAAVRKAFEAQGPGQVTLVEGGWGATSMGVQSSLVRAQQAAQPVDVLLGNAVAAEFAARFYKGQARAPRFIVSTYASDGVIKAMKSGEIDAMMANAPVTEARIAVDLAVRVLEERPFPKLVSVPARLVTRANLPGFQPEESVAPEGLRIPLKKLPPRTGKAAP
jgi:protein TorT